MKYSPLIVGTMRWGIWGANHSSKNVQQLIDAALAEGLTTFDHADIYGDYTTEELFGSAFREMHIAREEIQLITKCGIEIPCPNRNYKVKAYNYSKQHIIKSVEQSLKNLHTDYINLLLLHRPSPLMDPLEIAEAFEILMSQQKVLNFGVSNFSASQFELIDSAFPLVTNQVEISINQTQSFYDGTLDQLLRRKQQPMAWSVMGNYFTEKSAQNNTIKPVLKELSGKYTAEENQLLLAFILKHPAHILPVIGTSKVETLCQLRKSTDINLDRSDWFKLLEAARGAEVD